MDALLRQIEDRITRPDRTAPAVSAWSVHRHLDHTALSALHMARLIRDLGAGRGESSGRPKLTGRVVLLTGWIPRGKGKAPDFTAPAESVDAARVREMVEEVRAILAEDGSPRGKLRAPHPLLGSFTARQWRRFLTVHTRHHLKIVRDIDAAAGP
jgi:hypothetical protein